MRLDPLRAVELEQPRAARGGVAEADGAGDDAVALEVDAPADGVELGERAGAELLLLLPGRAVVGEGVDRAGVVLEVAVVVGSDRDAVAVDGDVPAEPVLGGAVGGEQALLLGPDRAGPEEDVDRARVGAVLVVAEGGRDDAVAVGRDRPAEAVVGARCRDADLVLGGRRRSCSSGRCRPFPRRRPERPRCGPRRPALRPSSRCCDRTGRPLRRRRRGASAARSRTSHRAGRRTRLRPTCRRRPRRGLRRRAGRRPGRRRSRTGRRRLRPTRRGTGPRPQAVPFHS